MSFFGGGGATDAGYNEVGGFWVAGKLTHIWQWEAEVPRDRYICFMYFILFLKLESSW